MNASAVARSSSAEVPSGGTDVSKSFVAHAVYGLVTILAVLQGMELHPPPGAWQGAVILFGTTLAVALVDAYADSIGHMLAHQTRLTSHDLAHIAREVAPVMIGAQGPTVVFILAAIGVFSLERAIDIAQVIAFVTLFGYGVRIGSLLHEGWSRRMLSGLLLVLIGGIIVGIKAAFH